MPEVLESRDHVSSELPAEETLPYPIAAIGASAGGVEAYIDLLHSLPCDTGMAFVLVPHLAPDHKSHLVEILAHHTEMPVVVIEDNTRPLPNHIYVLPPNALLNISRGILSLEPSNSKSRAYSIDHFFRALAVDQRNMAIGVVLSGMNSDGASGLNAIKGEGGIALVQEPASARQPAMPLSSIAADHVDLVVPPAELAAELARLGHLYSKPELRPLEAGLIAPKDEDGLRKIFELLRAYAGVEFALYKPGTMYRRISRRLLVTKTDSVKAYAALLRTSEEELRLLYEDLLVGLTWFFRDPEMYDQLKSTVFPKIFKDRSGPPQIRIWVAGCSTGQEVYSLVMALLEYTSINNLEPVIQVFGTDVSERAIEKARAGSYPENISTEVSPERLRRFFTHADKGYQVSKRVRDLCVFARQNLCTDPPFSRVDILTCRNVLIYLGNQLQKRVIPAFHYALKPDGYLILGQSEALRDFSEIFEPLDRKSKIFAKQESSYVSFDLPRFISSSTVPTNRAPVAVAPLTWSNVELQHAADRAVLATYAPPGLVINERLEILQVRGQMAPYLDMAQGSASLHLLRMLNASIAHVVRDAVQKTIEEEIPVRCSGLTIPNSDHEVLFDLEVFPIQVQPSQERCFLVLFVARNSAVAAISAERKVAVPLSVEESDQGIAQLRQDLASNKHYLQSLIEERDLKNEELTSSNEEVQSANEELQSTNEELETTKEELQSSNEELQTVNEELQQRNTVLADTANDLSNLLISVNIPVIMLNNDLQIRQFTPVAQKLLAVRTSDIGRPITEIRLNLAIDNLEQVLQEVQDTLSTREMDVQDKEGRWHILRIRPYRTSDNKIEGVVLVLLDVDQLRRSQSELRHAVHLGQEVIEAIQIPLVVLERNLVIHSANTAFRSLTELPREQLQGRLFCDVAMREFGLNTLRPVLEEVAKNGQAGPIHQSEVETFERTKTFYFSAKAVQANGSVVVLVTLENITARKEAERILARENEVLAHQVQSTSLALGQSQQELRALTARLINTQEEERRRVARELHDDLGQRLAMVQMDLEQVPKRLAADPATLDSQLKSLGSAVAGLSDDLRKISHRLHPSMLDDLGLGYALQSLVEEFGERENMPATLTRLNVPESIPQNLASALYRIAQESLRNISKHAGKTHVRVVLEGTGTDLCLEVIDMGEGFDSEDRVAGLGLLSMAERAHLVGGVLKVKSLLGRGTSIKVTVPLLKPLLESYE